MLCPGKPGFDSSHYIVLLTSLGASQEQKENSIAYVKLVNAIEFKFYFNRAHLQYAYFCVKEVEMQTYIYIYVYLK